MATRKKTSRKRGPDKAKSSSGRLLPQGTPTDDQGNPLEDTEVSASLVGAIGLDAESARINQEHRETMTRKTRGENRVRWNADEAVRFREVYEFSPSARVRIKQIEPVEDDSIGSFPISMFRGDYGELIKYIRSKHWDGEQVRYKWTCYSNNSPQIATGIIVFKTDYTHQRGETKDEEEEMPPRRSGPEYPPPPWSFAPPGYPQTPPGCPPQGYGMGYPQAPPPMPPMMPFYQQGMYPPMMQPQPAPQQPQPQPQRQQAGAPLPVVPQIHLPPGVGNDGIVKELLGQLTAVVQQNAALHEQVRHNQQQPVQQPQPQQPDPMQMMQYYWWLAQQQVMQAQPKQDPQPPAPLSSPTPPPNPIQQARETVSMMSDLMTLGRSFAQQVSPPDQAKAEAEEKKAEQQKKEEELPHVFKELPHMRAVFNRDGTPVDATTSAMYNGDKIIDGLKGIFGEVRKVLQDHTQMVDKGEEIRKKKIEDMERVASLAERIRMAQISGQAPQPPQPQPQPQPPQVQRTWQPQVHVPQPPPRQEQDPPSPQVVRVEPPPSMTMPWLDQMPQSKPEPAPKPVPIPSPVEPPAPDSTVMQPSSENGTEKEEEADPKADTDPAPPDEEQEKPVDQQEKQASLS